ncbi:MAG: leucine-rich repeat domain-containing protein [Methanobrevibacter sp.]|nr:leucine-rich repeat domain-containing protein [Methanobrevibacter sp.]
MGQYTSYYLYQKFEKIGNQDYIPVYPNVYSIDADGTMPTVVKEQNDVNCGYNPPVDPIYRWVDSGTTCVGLDKYQRAIKQVSNDGGTTWENVSPAEYSATTLIEGDSPDCVPKLIANYSDSSRYIVVCNSSTTLTQEEVRDYSTPYSSMTSAVIGDCVTSIGDAAFSECYSLTSIDIPNNVASIGVNAFYGCGGLTSVNIPDNIKSILTQAFYGCSGLTSVTIGSGVIKIYDYAFYGCSSLTGITIYATTPPEMIVWMDGRQFDNTNNCPIYVPAASVNAYKAAAGWRVYANRIQAIP